MSPSSKCDAAGYPGTPQGFAGRLPAMAFAERTGGDFRIACDTGRAADASLHCAEGAGYAGREALGSDLKAHTVVRAFLEASLRTALVKGEFVLYYQPRINLATGAVVGAEALLRWAHPDWGMVFPEGFVPVAEDCGLVVPIVRWTLHQACAQGRQWLDAGLPFGSIAVRIAASAFRDRAFVEDVRTALERSRLPPQCLQLEFPDTVLACDGAASIAKLRQLKELDIRMACDGRTGDRDIALLIHVPTGAATTTDAFPGRNAVECGDGITATPFGTPDRAGLRTVADGVATQAQFSMLLDMHCDQGQGSFFSSPLTAGKYAALVEIAMPKCAADGVSLLFA